MKNNTEKRRIMRKRTPVFSVFMLISVILSGFCACTRPAMQTPASLLRTIAAAAPAYAFSPEALIYKDGVYFAFYSLHEENDLLLSMRVDTSQQVTRAALTAKTGCEAANSDLAQFGLLLSELLLPEDCDQNRLAAATGLALLPQTPPEILNEYTWRNDRAALFCGEHALCFFVELRASAEPASDEVP